MDASGRNACVGRTPHFDHPWIGALVEAIDGRLRRHLGVSEFTRSPDCIFRVGFTRSSINAVLSNGTLLRSGDRVANLHLWSEQVPRMFGRGPTFGWARRMSRCLDVSLRELAWFLAQRRDLDDIGFIRTELTLAPSERRIQLIRLMGRCGFQAVETPQASTPQRLHRLGENIFISLMVLAHNASALRRDTLRRDRVDMYLTRRILDERYGREYPPA
jgi:hypothetical protein